MCVFLNVLTAVDMSIIVLNEYFVLSEGYVLNETHCIKQFVLYYQRIQPKSVILFQTVLVLYRHIYLQLVFQQTLVSFVQ